MDVNRKPRVFVSYVREDDDHRVRELTEHLGRRVEVSLGPAAQGGRSVEKELRAATRVLVVWSGAYRRRWEADGARFDGEFILNHVVEEPSKYACVLLDLDPVPKAFSSLECYHYPRDRKELELWLTQGSKTPTPPAGPAHDGPGKHPHDDLTGCWIYAAQTGTGAIVGSFIVGSSHATRGEMGLSGREGTAYWATGKPLDDCAVWGSVKIVVGVDMLYVKYTLTWRPRDGKQRPPEWGTIELSLSEKIKTIGGQDCAWTGSFQLDNNEQQLFGGPVYAQRLKGHEAVALEATVGELCADLLKQLDKTSKASGSTQVWTAKTEAAHATRDQFFGWRRRPGVPPVDLVFCQRKTRGKEDPFDYGEHTDSDDNPLWPRRDPMEDRDPMRLYAEDVKGWLAVEDVQAATHLSDLFGSHVRVCTDKTLVKTNWRKRTTIALGLGFTRHTRNLLSRGDTSESNNLSRYVQIVWPEDSEDRARTDAIVFNGKFYGEPVDEIDHAIVARVVIRRVAHFVCAGRTARGTEAAGLFLRENWDQFEQAYEEAGLLLREHSMVLLVSHPATPHPVPSVPPAPEEPLEKEDIKIVGSAPVNIKAKPGDKRDRRETPYKSLLATAILGVLGGRGKKVGRAKGRIIAPANSVELLAHWLQVSAEAASGDEVIKSVPPKRKVAASKRPNLVERTPGNRRPDAGRPPGAAKLRNGGVGRAFIWNPPPEPEFQDVSFFKAPPRRPLRLFYCFAPEDAKHCRFLDKHLKTLGGESLLQSCWFRDVTAGDGWHGAAHAELEHADLILFLVSEAFLGTGYFDGKEAERARERHELGKARVIPIGVGHADCGRRWITRLGDYPSDGRPVTEWPSMAAAWKDIAAGIRSAIDEMAGRRSG